MIFRESDSEEKVVVADDDCEQRWVNTKDDDRQLLQSRRIFELLSRTRWLAGWQLPECAQQIFS